LEFFSIKVLLQGRLPGYCLKKNQHAGAAHVSRGRALAGVDPSSLNPWPGWGSHFNQGGAIPGVISLAHSNAETGSGQPSLRVCTRLLLLRGENGRVKKNWKNIF
jgi:hypothetical protein